MRGLVTGSHMSTKFEQRSLNSCRESFNISFQHSVTYNFNVRNRKRKKNGQIKEGKEQSVQFPSPQYNKLAICILSLKVLTCIEEPQ